MGLVSSCLYCKVEVNDFETFEGVLDTGDIVWVLSHGASNKPFMLKHRFWIAFSHVGFLVRTGPGPQGLMLCMPKLAPELVQPIKEDGNGQGEPVTMYPLMKEIHSSNSRLAVTCLSPHLGPEAVQAVRELASSSCMRSMNARVPLHLSQTSKVFVTELVARMLEVAQLAARVGKHSSGRYFSRGNLALQHPFYARLPKRRRSLNMRLSSQAPVFQDSSSEGTSWSDASFSGASPLRPRRLEGLSGGWAPAASGELPDCEAPVNADVVPRQRRRTLKPSRG